MSLFLKPPKFAGNYSPESSDIIKQMTSDFLDQAKTSWASVFIGTTDFFKSYLWREIFFNIRLVLAILCFIMLFLIITVIIKKMGLRAPAVKLQKESVPIIKFNKRKIYKKWTKIEKQAESGVEANYKLAILAADKLFDDIIKIVGLEKENTLGNISAIKQARKIKNNIIDDKGFFLNKEDTAKALEAYKKALQELGAM